MDSRKIARLEWDGKPDHEPRVGQWWGNETFDRSTRMYERLADGASPTPRRCFDPVYETGSGEGDHGPMDTAAERLSDKFHDGDRVTEIDMQMAVVNLHGRLSQLESRPASEKAPPPNPPESVVAEFVRDLKRNESLGTARMSISAERAKELHTALASRPPVTEEMVERVAIAIHRSFWSKVSGCSWEPEAECSKEAWRSNARAAIEAMGGKA